MVEARYRCASCDHRFSLAIDKGSDAKSTSICPGCSSNATLREVFDPMSRREEQQDHWFNRLMDLDWYIRLGLVVLLIVGWVLSKFFDVIF